MTGASRDQAYAPATEAVDVGGLSWPATLSNAPVFILASADHGEKIGSLVADEGLDLHVHPSADALLDHLSPEATAVVCAEYALDDGGLLLLSAWLRRQPTWSDLPFIVLAEGPSQVRRRRLLEALGNVVFLTAADDLALWAALQSARYSRQRRSIMRAASERQLADLAQSEKNTLTVFETSHQYQGLLGVDGRITYVNATALAGIGARLEDVIDQPYWESPWFSATPGMPEQIRAAVEAVAAGQEVAMKTVLTLPSGEATFDFSLRPVFDEQGQVVAMVPEAVNVTARLQTEEALRQAQKMEAVGQLTGGVAHDFNNLLTVIKSSSELLKRPNLSEERRARYIAAISETTDRAAKLTAQLLAFARQQALQPKVFDVARSVVGISDVVTTLCGSRIELVTDLPDGPCFVDADPSQFDTALINMVVNARDAMGGEGRLTIRVDGLDGIPAVRAHPAVQAPYVAVSVQDIGVGMAPEMLNKIFEPFFTTKQLGEGTGLGLSQVFGFAKQSEGEVVVHSEAGVGSTFTLYLRRVNAPAAAEADPYPDDLEAGHGAHVLVVEDNSAIGQFVTQGLEDLGYRSRWVGGAEQALAALADPAQDFDIVFSDVVMSGMDGLALGQEIHRLYPGLPVVLSSGYSEVLVRDRDHGFDLLQKPYSVEQLSKALRLAIAKLRSMARQGLPG